jgi:antitoxin (DNA-binding transcriptional repressor) of toxin-antitoxin stability system
MTLAMKTVTVRELRSSFARVSRWLEAGETIEVTKRGQVFAHILPVNSPKTKLAPKPDILARLRTDFGAAVVTDEIYDAVMREDGVADAAED